MELGQKIPIVGKDLIFTYDKKDRDNVTNLLMKFLPDRIKVNEREKIIGEVVSIVDGKWYTLYFTDERIIGNLLTGNGPAIIVDGIIMLAEHEKNFSIDYGDIDSVFIKKELCKMKFIQKLPIVGKKAVIKLGKKNKTTFISILTKVIPDKVVVK
jgi:hypothetical protein